VNELRADAARDELAAREREATSARAAADAKQAEVDAERLRREADERERAAAEARDEQAAKLNRADAVDPNVRTDRHGNRIEGDRADGDGGPDRRV
jgi:ribonuclease E